MEIAPSARPAADPSLDLLELPGGEIALLDEKTRRRWTVALAPFSLARVPVTEGLYARAAPERSAPDPRLPATGVSWLDAVRFCNLLSRAAGFRECYTVVGGGHGAGRVEWDRAADGYRLPTEAEWEHACRAGSTDERPGDLDEIAWYRDNAGDGPRPVGLKAPNAWGLHDTIGNVWEWCWDVFDPEVYGEYRVFRGGGWFDPPRSARASCRRKSHPTFAIDDLGFRLARSRPG